MQKQPPQKGAKSGQPPGRGEPESTWEKKDAPRPVDEEDTFGGAERVRKNKRVTSEGAKP